VFVPEDKYQEQFITYMQNPQEKFVGFTIIEPLRHSGFHIFGIYIMPEYRETNLIRLGLTYLEGEARKMGAPYLSAATRHDVSGALAKLGFVETTCNYRKKLKE
jgi:ribosomal protein S18 acetylase RimI-like enzyme